jgi:hypothetical protein
MTAAALAPALRVRFGVSAVTGPGHALSRRRRFGPARRWPRRSLRLGRTLESRQCDGGIWNQKSSLQLTDWLVYSPIACSTEGEARGSSGSTATHRLCSGLGRRLRTTAASGATASTPTPTADGSAGDAAAAGRRSAAAVSCAPLRPALSPRPPRAPPRLSPAPLLSPQDGPGSLWRAAAAGCCSRSSAKRAAAAAAAVAEPQTGRQFGRVSNSGCARTCPRRQLGWWDRARPGAVPLDPGSVMPAPVVRGGARSGIRQLILRPFHRRPRKTTCGLPVREGSSNCMLGAEVRPTRAECFGARRLLPAGRP